MDIYDSYVHRSTQRKKSSISSSIVYAEIFITRAQF